MNFVLLVTVTGEVMLVGGYVETRAGQMFHDEPSGYWHRAPLPLPQSMHLAAQ
jgi:hypothetical protein